MRLFTYKLTHDTGFAPNPFHGFLTLATCKPGIRRTKAVDDWVAGFTSKALSQNASGSSVAWDGVPRLIYLMRITDRLNIAEYFSDKRFVRKIPQIKGSAELRAGDNIYRPLAKGAISPSEFEIIANLNHPAAHGHIETDLSGVNVLVSNEFYYFGVEAIRIPDESMVNVPKGPSRYGQLTDGATAMHFIDFISKHYKQGVHGLPHMWDDSYLGSECRSRADNCSSRCAR